jgi:hypothetical protein
MAEACFVELIYGRSFDEALAHLRDQAAQPFHWVYFARDYTRLSRLRASAPPGAVEVESGPLINQALNELHEELVNVDLRSGTQPAGSLDWTTYDRSPFGTWLHEACAYVAFGRLADGLTGRLLVFVDSWHLGWALRRRARQLGLPSCYVMPGHGVRVPPSLLYASYVVRQLMRAVAARLRFLRTWWNARRQLGRRRAGAIGEDVRELDALLVVWGDPGAFRVAGPYRRDPYWGIFPEALAERSLTIGLLIVQRNEMYSSAAILDSVRQCGTPNLFVEECLRVTDALALALLSFGRSWRALFRGWGGGPVAFCGLEEMASERVLWSRQFFYVAAHLRRRGVKVRQVFHLYEGQPWERSLRSGFRRWLPDARLYGYQHVPPQPSPFNSCPSRTELHPSVRPDGLVVIGSRQRSIMTRHGIPADEVVVGPSLRFPHVSKTCPGGRERVGRPARVLAAPSAPQEEAIELVSKVLQTLGNSDEVEVLVKFHPMFPFDPRVMATCLACVGLSELPSNVSHTDRPISELLQEVDLVLYMSSAVSLEAAARGLPVVFVQSDLRIDLDRLWLAPELALSARTPEDLRRLVMQLLSTSADEARARRRRTQAFLEGVFTPVSTTSVERMVSLCFGVVNSRGPARPAASLPGVNAACRPRKESRWQSKP